MASVPPRLFPDFYRAVLAKGMKPTLARLTLARKMAAITLTLWKKGVALTSQYGHLSSMAIRSNGAKG